ncbi:hypothetical protein OO184_09520 [Photorhabdus sp. APURE]|uniref:hypothetical protein n=1 Tax=Photorhabdus aballayi TaxID=2991723 RepID=UPI00223D3360|nr:hypothetical protein [Photorhabdus aballayi]MCW7548167.1 hypothetical protein [Photorhabdus aballayi]
MKTKKLDLADEYFDNYYHAGKAVRDTMQAIETIKRTQLTKLALPHVHEIFSRIRQTAKNGEGKLDYIFPQNCPLNAQKHGIQYIRTCGYKVHKTDNGWTIIWGNTIIIG